MARLAATGAPEGSWLRADRQSAGRGRQGRPWVSPLGNLYASTLVRIRRTDPPAPTLALVAGVALEEAVRAHAPDAALALKWPNDLLLGTAKLAGILLERSGDAVVAGFGINLVDAPAIAGRATAALSPAPPAEIMVETLAGSFARWLAIWRGHGLEPVRRRWMQLAHPIDTALRVAITGEAARDGLYRGLGPDGALHLLTAEGLVEVRAGDVFLI